MANYKTNFNFGAVLENVDAFDDLLMQMNQDHLDKRWTEKREELFQVKVNIWCLIDVLNVA